MQSPRGLDQLTRQSWCTCRWLGPRLPAFASCASWQAARAHACCCGAVHVPRPERPVCSSTAPSWGVLRSARAASNAFCTCLVCALVLALDEELLGHGPSKTKADTPTNSPSLSCSLPVYPQPRSPRAFGRDRHLPTRQFKKMQPDRLERLPHGLGRTDILNPL